MVVHVGGRGFGHVSRKTSVAAFVGGGEPASGTPLSASTLTRTTGVTTYPPEVDFTRPVDWQDGDQAIMQWSTDATFATGVSETASPVTLDAAILTYDFGLSAIVSGSVFMRLTAWRGSRPSSGSLIWSNIVNVGDTVAPTMTSAASFNATENQSTNFALAADEGATFAVVGGTFAADVSISGSTLTLSAENYEVNTSGTIIIRPTDYAGNDGSDQTITVTVLDVDEQPDALGFTDSSGVAADGATYTSTITIAGVAAGIDLAGTFSGDGNYRIHDGVSWSAVSTAANFTVQLGYQIESNVDASLSATTVTSNTFSIGEPATSDTHSVTTAASLPSIGGTWSTIVWPAQVTMYQGVTAAGTQATANGDPVGYIEDYAAANFDWKAASTAANVRPLLGISGSRKWLTFDGANAYLRAATDIALGAYAAGSCSMIFVGQFNPANIAALFAEGHSTNNNTAYVFREYSASATGELEAFLRHDADSTQTSFSSNSNISAGSPKPLDNNPRVIVIVDTGSAITAYVDRVKMTTRTYTRSTTIPNRVALMGWLRGTVGSLMAGDLEFAAIANGYTFTDGSVATGANANGEVGSLSTFGGALQGRTI